MISGSKYLDCKPSIKHSTLKLEIIRFNIPGSPNELTLLRPALMDNI